MEEYLRTLNDRDLANVFEAVFAETVRTNENPVSMIPFITVFLERINNYSDKYLVSLITDPERDDYFRATVFELYSDDSLFEGRTSRGMREIKKLLKDDSFYSYNPYLKGKLIINLDFDSDEELKMLNDFASCDDEYVAWIAQRKLEWINGGN